MITKQDLEVLERLYTPLSKILLEHLREDHGYNSSIDQSNELVEEFYSLKVDYVELKRINQNLERENNFLMNIVSNRLEGT